jgi:hypothetical protein
VLVALAGHDHEGSGRINTAERDTHLAERDDVDASGSAGDLGARRVGTRAQAAAGIATADEKRAAGPGVELNHRVHAIDVRHGNQCLRVENAFVELAYLDTARRLRFRQSPPELGAPKVDDDTVLGVRKGLRREDGTNAEPS